MHENNKTKKESSIDPDILNGIKRGFLPCGFCKNNRETVLEAVRSNGLTLQYASDKLRSDKEIVRIAVNQHGGALEYASFDLRDDREIVLEAVKQYGTALIYASPRFCDDKEVIIAALKSPLHYDEADNYLGYGREEVILGCMSHRLRSDPIVNRFAIKNYDGLLSNLIFGWELRNLKKEQEENWQKKYGAFDKNRKERWQCDLMRWQKRKKDNQLEDYTVLRKEIEQMPKYRIWREAVLNLHNRQCQICGKTSDLEVHHRRSLYSILNYFGVDNVYKAFECSALWDVYNGDVVCQSCHENLKSSKYRNEQINNSL